MLTDPNNMNISETWLVFMVTKEQLEPPEVEPEPGLNVQESFFHLPTGAAGLTVINEALQLMSGWGEDWRVDTDAQKRLPTVCCN